MFLHAASRGTWLATIAMLAFGWGAECIAQQTGKTSTKERTHKEIKHERVSGVLLKVEPAEQGDHAKEKAWTLTIGTDVVWRDFVRDQAVGTTKAATTKTEKAAAKGKESVATKGHPRDDQTMVRLILDPKTPVVMRYRSSTDEISEGATTPEGAAKVEAATDKSVDRQTKTDVDSKHESMKARSLKPSEIKAGLWVDVEYANNEQGKRVERIVVLQPVGGADTSPEQEQPSSPPK